MPSPDLIALLPGNRFSNKLAFKVSNNIPRNPLLCSFASFLIVLLTPFINKQDSSSDLAALVAHAAVNPNGIKRASCFSTFFIKSNPCFSNGSKNLTKNHSDCSILCN